MAKRKYTKSRKAFFKIRRNNIEINQLREAIKEVSQKIAYLKRHGPFKGRNRHHTKYRTKYKRSK